MKYVGFRLVASRGWWGARRGMATFKEGLPEAWKDTNKFRFIFGAREGLVGVYPVSATEIFYFCSVPGPKARRRPYVCVNA